MTLDSYVFLRINLAKQMLIDKDIRLRRAFDELRADMLAENAAHMEMTARPVLLQRQAE